jgi:hypothetical protein
MPHLNVKLRDFFLEVLEVCYTTSRESMAADAEEMGLSVDELVAAALAQSIHQRFTVLDGPESAQINLTVPNSPHLHQELHEFFEKVLEFCYVKTRDCMAAEADKLGVTFEGLVAAALTELIQERFTVLDSPGNAPINLAVPNSPLEIRIHVAAAEPTPAVKPKGRRRTPSP